MQVEGKVWGRLGPDEAHHIMHTMTAYNTVQILTQQLSEAYSAAWDYIYGTVGAVKEQEGGPRLRLKEDGSIVEVNEVPDAER